MFTMKTQGGVSVVKSGLLDGAGGAAHGFSTRAGGVSRGVWSGLNLSPSRGDDPAAVAENYRRFCAVAGIDAPAARVRQVHGKTIHVVTGENRTDAPVEADGLVTAERGIALAVLIADCIPVLLYDPRRRVVAAVHSGWRGTAQAICAEAVETMRCDFGCAAEDILAAVGPGISACCFETRADVPDAMRAAFGARVDDCIVQTGEERYRVDLKGIVRHTLLDEGLTEAHIDVCADCTACPGERYWSHRRLGEARGSMAAVIALL